MAFCTLDDVVLTDKTVLLRADINVPMKDGKVTDMDRLIRLLPTLKDLAKANAKIVILSHLGRPDGKVSPKYSLRPVAEELARVWGRPVAFAEDCIGPKAKDAVAALKGGDIVVLENTRFHPEEEQNDPGFSKELASLGDIYVDDAFSSAHRAHASTEGMAHFLPRAAGRSMQAELEALQRALSTPLRPVAAIVGGSKISTKLDLLQNLLCKVDVLILGGGMANTFLAAQGINIGKSLYEPDMLDTARTIARRGAERHCRILLPTDVVVAKELAADVPTQTVAVANVPSDQMILDIGPASVKEIERTLRGSKTIVWNGPVGAFEFPPFDQATTAIALAVARLTKEGSVLSVAGGGDTVAALAHAKAIGNLSYVSAAGGAFLEWLEGKTLPGVAALDC